MVNQHELAEERSLAIHRLIADRLRKDPGIAEVARGRVAAWLADGSVHRVYAEAWRELLSGPLPRLLEVLVDPGERANIVYREAKGKKPYAVLVAVDDEETVEAIEDVIDARAAEKTLAEMKRKGEKPIPYERARKELGLK